MSFKVDLVCIPVTIHIFLSNKGFNKKAKSLWGADDSITYSGATLYSDFDHNNIIIGVDVDTLVKDGQDLSGTIGLLVHEYSHAITIIFDKLGFNDDELRSYLLQFICTESIGKITTEYNTKKDNDVV